MQYNRSSLQPILNLLKSGESFSPTEISIHLGKSKVIIHKYLKALIEQGELEKVGKGTHVKYRLQNINKQDINHKNTLVQDFQIPYHSIDIIEKEFLKYAANGELLSGYQGFIKRCQVRNLQVAEKAEQFVAIYKHILSIQNKCGLLDVSKVFQQNIKPTHIDQLYYADQYKRMEFGRGKLAEMTFYAKQSQNIGLINQSLDLIWNKLICLIKATKPDAIAITPHSIKRNKQILIILHHRLKQLDMPFISLIKYFPNKIAIPQKSLKTRQQRVQNAKETILINNPAGAKKYKKLLLIDDFVGSGATLNETADKLKQNGAKTILGFAFVGNANLKYDVINEV